MRGRAFSFLFGEKKREREREVKRREEGLRFENEDVG
jgi:hypothetical protein